MDSKAIADALQRWMKATSQNATCRQEASAEEIKSFLSGPAVDTAAGRIFHSCQSIPLYLINHFEYPISMRCLSHALDVPGDGNCGFSALWRAAAGFKPSSAVKANMTVQECRNKFVSFLQTRRRDIEKELLEFFGKERIRHYLWGDAPGSEVPSDNMCFAELCNSLRRSGMHGHWLGSGIGELEIHLLARFLEVTVHGVAGARTRYGSYALRQTFGPLMALWGGGFELEPRGAAIIRFMGQFNYGHYQVVFAGTRRSATTKHKVLASSKSRVGQKEPISMRRRTLNGKPNSASQNPKAPIHHIMSSDVATIRGTHGVQPETKQRYKKDYRLVASEFEKLSDLGINPLELKENGARVVHCLESLLLRRCGPKEKGYEGLSARTTGNVILASVAKWYEDHGISFSLSHTCVVHKNSVTGPPWRAQQLLNFKSTLEKGQAKARSNPVRRAYQLTHDDIASAMRKFVASQMGEAPNMNFLPRTIHSVDWLQFQTALMVTAAFGSGAWGAELVGIRLSDIRLLREGPDTDIGITLYGVKSKSASRIVRTILLSSWKETCVINPSLAVLIQLSIVHGIYGAVGNEGSPLFPNIVNNQVQKGQQMSSKTYGASIKKMFGSLGITDRVKKHSPRRGASGFRYYVLKENLYYIRDFLGHESIVDTIAYVGFEDKNNSYIAQGYGTCDSQKLR